MSIQELKEAVQCLPLIERSALLAELAAEVEKELAEMTVADNARSVEREALNRRRQELAAAAAPYWAGGDGLAYQSRIRDEWGDGTAEA